MAVFSKLAVAAATLLPSVLASQHTKATFAVLHFYGNGPLLEGRMDPIVDPGVVSGHVHTVQGANAFALNMTDDFASQATCTTSRVNRDLSNYWAPKLYFQSPKNGTFFDVPLDYMNVYYFFDNTDDDLVPFPKGFRMTSGNPMLRSAPAVGAELQLDSSKGEIQPVDWVCPQSTNKPAWPAGSNGLKIGMESKTVGEGVGFPNKNCDGLYSPLRSDIHFPSCISKNPSLNDEYKNNTAWPAVSNTTQNWNCPSGYDHVPHLFYELYWQTPQFANEWTPGGDSQPFVLSNGDPTGYSLHGDFISGWDTDALQYMIDNCNAGDSGMDTCTGVPGGTVTGSGKQPPSCNMVTPFEEVITGAMDKLPGCNPVQAGPGTATMATTCGPSPTILNGGKAIMTGSAAGLIPTGGASAVGGAITSAANAKPTTMATHVASSKSSSSSKAQATTHNYAARKEHRRRSQHLKLHREAAA